MKKTITFIAAVLFAGPLVSVAAAAAKSLF